MVIKFLRPIQLLVMSVITTLNPFSEKIKWKLFTVRI